MKIIEHGNTLKIEVCKKCNCKFEYREVDIEKQPYDYMGYKYIKRILKCPECGNIIENNV